MKADTLDLTQLFANPVRYLVPIFQRPYVWTQEQHWEPLWEDIKAVAELVATRQAANDEPVTSGVPPHFLGAVVLDQVLNPTGSLQSRYVIDGQQRLTTMQLFLSAAREVAAKQELGKQATTLQRLTNNPDDLLDEDVDERFKVWPTMRDREAFIAVMDHEGQISKGDNLASHKMAYAEDFFRARIAEWVTDEDANDGENRMPALVGVISRMLKLVVIDLEPDDNSQVIFETLNARGTRLLASDLVKNLVFQRAALSDTDLQALYDEYWKPFDTDHWRRDIRQGRLNRPRVEVFLFHWLVMQTEDEVSASGLFQSFKGLVDAGDRTVVDLLGEFRRMARPSRLSTTSRSVARLSNSSTDWTRSTRRRCFPSSCP